MVNMLFTGNGLTTLALAQLLLPAWMQQRLRRVMEALATSDGDADDIDGRR